MTESQARRQVAAAARRAGGERAGRRHRTTPLLAGLEPDAATAPEAARPAEPEAASLPDTATTDVPTTDTATTDVPATDTATTDVPATPSAVELPGTGDAPVTTEAGATGTGTSDASATGAVTADAPAPRPRASRAAATRRRPRASGPATSGPVVPGPTTEPPTEPASGPASGPAEPGRPAPGAPPRAVPVRRRPVVRVASEASDPARRATASRRTAGGERLVAVPDDVPARRPTPPRARPGADRIDRRVAAALAFLRRRLTGDYPVDDFGFDADLTDTVLLNVFRPLYRRWFRVEVRGIENIPATGGALVVANHGGAIALDALMTSIAVHDEHPAHRHLRMLGADLVFSTPVLGELARKGGATLASNADAERLLGGGELVGVWPEGFKGIGKPFSERYKLQRFGRGGFVSAALRTRTPIVPCSIVGAEETYPIIGDMPALARVLGVPYAPITPTWPLLGVLGLVPLPSKWLIEFGTPLPTDELGENAADDPMVVFDLTDQVRQTIQQTLYSLLVQRRSVFF